MTDTPPSMPQCEGLPWYSGDATFFRAPARRVEDLQDGSVAVLGVPLDARTLGRNGQRYGPRAIREASLYLAGAYGLQPTPVGHVDIESGELWSIPDQPRLFDVGDVQFPLCDIDDQIHLIGSKVAQIIRQGAFPVVLGGDHFTPYPSFIGFAEGVREQHPGAKIGFLILDAHFDLNDEVTGIGRWNHGTFARRVSEHDATGRMVWWGLASGGIHPDALDLFRTKRYVGYTVRSIRQRGVDETINEALEIASEGANFVYVTFDIDCTDGANAPGTHSIMTDGLSPRDVLAALAIISKCRKLGAFDVSEMLPLYDVGGGRTARYAAQAILTVIRSRVLDHRAAVDPTTLTDVFP